jgi:hypothetical protein
MTKKIAVRAVVRTLVVVACVMFNLPTALGGEKPIIGIGKPECGEMDCKITFRAIELPAQTFKHPSVSMKLVIFDDFMMMNTPYLIFCAIDSSKESLAGNLGECFDFFLRISGGDIKKGSLLDIMWLTNTLEKFHQGTPNGDKVKAEFTKTAEHCIVPRKAGAMLQCYEAGGKKKIDLQCGDPDTPTDKKQ